VIASARLKIRCFGTRIKAFEQAITEKTDNTWRVPTGGGGERTSKVRVPAVFLVSVYRTASSKLGIDEPDPKRRNTVAPKRKRSMFDVRRSALSSASER
jgi:hypothetical protein